MNQKVDLGSSRIVGQGLFARGPIARHEPIFFITGRYVPLPKCLQLPDEGANTIQVSHDGYIDPGFPAAYLNHSCDPNCGVVDDICVIALRHIAPGEEVCLDYSTTMMERLWTMKCACGTRKCRGIVRDFDQLPQSLKDYYLDLGIVQNFILEHLTNSARTNAA